MKNNEGIELVNMRHVGGPHPGDYLVPITKIGGSWPPPDVIMKSETGKYQKQSHSNLPDTMIDAPNVSRGALYLWVEAE